MKTFSPGASASPRSPRAHFLDVSLSQSASSPETWSRSPAIGLGSESWDTVALLGVALDFTAGEDTHASLPGLAGADSEQTRSAAGAPSAGGENTRSTNGGSPRERGAVPHDTDRKLSHSQSPSSWATVFSSNLTACADTRKPAVWGKTSSLTNGGSPPGRAAVPHSTDKKLSHSRSQSSWATVFTSNLEASAGSRTPVVWGKTRNLTNEGSPPANAASPDGTSSTTPDSQTNRAMVFNPGKESALRPGDAGGFRTLGGATDAQLDDQLAIRHETGAAGEDRNAVSSVLLGRGLVEPPNPEQAEAGADFSLKPARPEPLGETQSSSYPGVAGPGCELLVGRGGDGAGSGQPYSEGGGQQSSPLPSALCSPLPQAQGRGHSPVKRSVKQNCDQGESKSLKLLKGLSGCYNYENGEIFVMWDQSIS